MGLNQEGLRAWGRGVRAISGHADPDQLLDAVDRFAWSVHLATGARWAWIEQGQQLTIEYPNGAVAPNPLLKIVREAELDADRFGKTIGLELKGKPGRLPTAVNGPSPQMSSSPALKRRKQAGLAG